MQQKGETGFEYQIERGRRKKKKDVSAKKEKKEKRKREREYTIYTLVTAFAAKLAVIFFFVCLFQVLP